MEEYPKMMLEFEECFATEEACQEYLYQMCWPDGVICPGCSHREFWITKTGRYRRKQCRCRISATAGTIFQDARTPLVCGFGLFGKWLARNMELVPWDFSRFWGLTDMKQHGLCSKTAYCHGQVWPRTIGRTATG